LFKWMYTQLSRFEEFVAIFFLGLMTIVAFLQVIGRHTPLPFSSWFEEILRYSFVWITMLGGAVALRKGTHIGVNFLTRFIPAKKQLYVNLWCELVSFPVCLCLFFLSLKLVFKIKTFGTISASMEAPMWLIVGALPIGFLLMVFHSFLSFGREMRCLLTSQKKGE